MKKRNLYLFSALMAFSLLTGCGRKMDPVYTTTPTMPQATSRPTMPETRPATMPTLPEDTVSPVHTVSPEDLTEATIEDGNGPIPSQETK